MNHRLISILNTIGCLTLSGLVVMQWKNEQKNRELMSRLRHDVMIAQEAKILETQRASELARDVAHLKEILGIAQKNASVTAEQFRQKSDLADEHARRLTANHQQLDLWQKALAERDAKLQSLNNELQATRTSLDSAISKLKTAGAR